MKIKLTKLFTYKGDYYFQLVLLPTMTIYKSLDKESKHWALSLEFMFWSIALIIYNDDETTIYTLEDN